MTATTKQIFTATSPITGEIYTRQSARAYTHAVIYFASVETQRERDIRNAAGYMELANEYTMIAEFLENGTNPDATHILRTTRNRGGSYNMMVAGVKSLWGAVCYDVQGYKISANNSYAKPRAEVAADYRRYAAQSVEDAQRILAKEAVSREAATFHHSYALATKAAAADTYYSRKVVVAVEIVAKKPKASKAAWAEAAK